MDVDEKLKMNLICGIIPPTRYWKLEINSMQVQCTYQDVSQLVYVQKNDKKITVIWKQFAFYTVLTSNKNRPVGFWSIISTRWDFK